MGARQITAAKKATDRQLGDAVAAKKIKKTNTRVSAHADALKKEAKDVKAMMKANLATLSSKVHAQRKAASAAITSANAKSAAAHAMALKSVGKALASAKKKAEGKFGKLFMRIAGERSRADKSLADAV